MLPCVYCGADVPAERIEIGKTHCTDDKCIAQWRRDRIESQGLALVLMHKQGMAWVSREDVPKNDMTRQGGQ